jgi:pantetheine-phosphate adenylyltransferase
MEKACYPGSFDPFTRGHLEIIERASCLCSQLTVAVIDNPAKRHLFSLEERKEMLQQGVSHLGNVVIDHFQGLLVDYLKDRQIGVAIRGLRDSSDAPVEMQMARLNRQMSGCETLWLAAEGQFLHISSSFVREIARLGGPYQNWVTPLVAQRMEAKLAQ